MSEMGLVCSMSEMGLALRLARTIQVLSDITTDMRPDDDDGDDDGEDAPRPSPPSPDLLRKFLEHRRATKDGR
jgi:hypothetical protein